VVVEHLGQSAPRRDECINPKGDCVVERFLSGDCCFLCCFTILKGCGSGTSALAQSRTALVVSIPKGLVVMELCSRIEQGRLGFNP